MTSATHDIRDAFFDALRQEAHDHPNLIVLTADMGAFSLDQFRKELPLQMINVGIAEQNLINLAAGLALGGKRVVAYSITSFILQRCYEQIKVHLADPGLPVTIAGIGPGITYSNDGHSHYAVQDVANARALPKFTILSPADPLGFAAAARMVCRTDGPLYVRLDKGSFPNLPGHVDEAGLRVVASGGTVLLLTTGIMGQQLPALVERLKARGVNAGAILVERLKPLNEGHLVEILRRYDAVVTIEEHLLTGGLGSSIAELIADFEIDTAQLRLGLPDTVVDLLHGDRAWMLEQTGLDPASVERRIVAYLERRSAASVAATGQRFISAGGELMTLDVPRFAVLLGFPESAFPEDVRRYIDDTDFSYRILTGQARERLLVEILETIDSGTLTVSGPHRKTAWQQGWSENLASFVASAFDPDALQPKFVRRGTVKRLNGDFIVPANPDFETAFVTVLRRVVLRHYLAAVDTIYEFGSGTGLNLLALAESLPGKRFVGLDWSPASCSIVDRLAATKGLSMEGRLFDMFAPDSAVGLTPRDGVFTIGALEQLGGDFTAFVAFLLEKRPSICVHCETMNEIYDRGDLADFAARRYSTARNYLCGFLTHLRQLEGAGRLEILQVQRTFGSQYHEGYSFVAWRPAGGTIGS